MKNKPFPIIIGIVLIAIISLVWWLTNSTNDHNQQNISDHRKTPSTANTSLKSNMEVGTTHESDPVPTFVDNSPIQKEFTQKINNLVEATQKCQADVEILFPVDSLDGPSKTYKNFSKFKDAIQKFYQVVEKRVEKSHELMTYMETMPDGEISSERLFAQLSSIED